MQVGPHTPVPTYGSGSRPRLRCKNSSFLPEALLGFQSEALELHQAIFIDGVEELAYSGHAQPIPHGFYLLRSEATNVEHLADALRGLGAPLF